MRPLTFDVCPATPCALPRGGAQCSPAPARHAARGTQVAIASALLVALAVSASPVAAQPPSDEPQRAAAAAQEPAVGDLSLEDVLGMEVQSVFGASKFLQKATEAPAAVTIVTAEEITRYGWRTLAEVLRSVRGFYVTDDRSWAYVGVRGFQRPGDYNTRVLLVVDGERMNDNVYDQALLQEDSPIDMADVERIEVVRGASSSLYGSSAFFGLVNVVTKSAAQGAALTTDLGTLGLRSGRARVGHEFANGATLGVTASAQTMDGMSSAYFPEFDAPDTNFGVARNMDFTRRRNVLGRFDLGGFGLKAGYNRRVHAFPTGAYGTAFNDPAASLEDETYFATGAWQATVSRDWTVNVRAAFHGYNYVGYYPYGNAGPEDGLDNVDIGRGKWLSSEARVSRTLAERHRVTAGVEHRQDLEMTLLNYSDVQQPYVDIGLRYMRVGAYLQDEWRLHRTLLVSAGVRWDRYVRFEDPVTPRVAAIYQPDDRTTVKMLYGQAYRAPNAYETDFQYPDSYKPNPSLRSEEIRTTEMLVERFVGSRVHLSGGAFRSSVSRLIDLSTDPMDGVEYYDNIDGARAAGVEGEIEAKWPLGVQARASYTYAHVRSTAGTSLTNAPAHVGQALFSAPLVRGAVIGLDARAMSARFTGAGSTVASHVVANATLSGTIVGGRVSYGFTVSNLTNQQYADPVAADFPQASVPQYGRTARLRLTVTF